MNFGLPEKEWEGPIACEFKLFEKHTKVMQYRCHLEKQGFRFYTPLFMFKHLKEDEIPEHLQVVIWKSASPVRTCGYLSGQNPLLVESDVVEYEFEEKKGHSIKYCIIRDGQTYSLYIPNEVFKGMAPPKRVYAQFAVESEN